MMILALLLASNVPAPALRPDVSAVVAEKLGTWRGSIDAGSGELHCVTEASSGDPEVDAVGCTALLTCVPRYKDRVIDSDDEKHDADTRRRLSDAVTRELTTCLTSERDRLATELIQRRSLASDGLPHAHN